MITKTPTLTAATTTTSSLISLLFTPDIVEKIQNSTNSPYDDFNPNDYNIQDGNLTFREISVVWDHRLIAEIILKSIIVLIIIIVGLIGNFTVIFLVLKRPKIRQQPVNIFIVNLAIADFLTTL